MPEGVWSRSIGVSWSLYKATVFWCLFLEVSRSLFTSVSRRLDRMLRSGSWLKAVHLSPQALTTRDLPGSPLPNLEIQT